MPKVAVYNVKGEQVGDIELNDEIFGVEVNEALCIKPSSAIWPISGRARPPPKPGARFRRRAQALEAEGDRPGPSREHSFPDLGRRRRHFRSPASGLPARDAEEGPTGGAAFRFFGQGAAGELLVVDELKID